MQRASAARDRMPCAEAEALLPLVADGAITSDDDPSLFAHLAECGDCQRDLAAHDLVDLALATGSAPGSAGPGRVRVLPWPVTVGGGLLAAAALFAAVLFAGPGASAPEPAPAVAEVEVIDVTEDADGRTVYVVERDGERLLVPELDQSDDVVREADAVPVVSPRR